MAESVDTIIIGAGIVGAGVAYALRGNASQTYLVEAESRSGTGTTSRNSGVIHAGLYYPGDSLKMKLCRRGAAMLYAFAAEHGVPHRKTGKYIVANSAEESAYLNLLLENVGGEIPLVETSTVPNGIRAERALFSPNTGLVDIHVLVDALLEASGVSVLFNQRVTGLKLAGKQVSLEIGGESYLANRVVNCAGLAAPVLGGRPHHFLAKGSYFQIRIPKEVEVPDLVYPAVPKGHPGLGIHLTRNLAGEAYLGPDVRWVDREDYGVDPADADRFFLAASRYLPWLRLGDLQPGYAGLRPKLKREGFNDFIFPVEGECGQLVHCLGIESPGLTAAMAIGEHVRALLEGVGT